MSKKPSVDELQQQITELTLDLQRTRADFENFRKRAEIDKQQSMERGEAKTALKMLPVIDTIERAIVHIPNDIAEHQWVQGVAGLIKQLDKALADMGIARIEAKSGTLFNPELHQAIQMDEDAVGEQEVVAEELQAGYTLQNVPIRHAMVKVTRQ
jgi:molecular chaperone GrpE